MIRTHQWTAALLMAGAFGALWLKHRALREARIKLRRQESALRLRAKREEWIAATTTELLSSLLADNPFHHSTTLAKRFQDDVESWRATQSFSKVVDTASELATAEVLLASLGEAEALTYEPGSKKDPKLDFRIHRASGRYEWVEVKTVSPHWNDDKERWERYQYFSFPQNASFVAERNFAGAAILGQAFNARRTFIDKTVEIEKKVLRMPADTKGPAWILFCSNGFDWDVYDLEDFADFYRRGIPRTDDSISCVGDQHIATKGYLFNRSIAGFHYLERQAYDVHAKEVKWDVCGPQFDR